MVLDEECGGLQGEKGKSPVTRIVENVNGERGNWLTVLFFTLPICDVRHLSRVSSRVNSPRDREQDEA